MTRLSRMGMIATLSERIAKIEKEHSFQPGWGWAQVEKRPTEVIVAFGRYQELLDLREEFEL